MLLLRFTLVTRCVTWQCHSSLDVSLGIATRHQAGPATWPPWDVSWTDRQPVPNVMGDEVALGTHHSMPWFKPKYLGLKPRFLGLSPGALGLNTAACSWGSLWENDKAPEPPKQARPKPSPFACDALSCSNPDSPHCVTVHGYFFFQPTPPLDSSTCHARTERRMHGSLWCARLAARVGVS